MPDVQARGVINDIASGQPVAVVSDPTNEQRWSVFSRQVGGVTVELEVDGDVIRDKATGSTFDPVRGIARSGPLAAESLELLPGFTSFPRDFETFWPDGTVWSES